MVCPLYIVFLVSATLNFRCCMGLVIEHYFNGLFIIWYSFYNLSLLFPLFTKKSILFPLFFFHRFFWWSEFFTRLFSVRIWCMGCFVGNTVSILLILWKNKTKKKHFRKYILNICYSDRSQAERLGRCCILPFTRSILPPSDEILLPFKEVILVRVVLKELGSLCHLFLNRPVLVVMFLGTHRSSNTSCKITEFLQFLFYIGTVVP